MLWKRRRTRIFAVVFLRDAHESLIRMIIDRCFLLGGKYDARDVSLVHYLRCLARILSDSLFLFAFPYFYQAHPAPNSVETQTFWQRALIHRIIMPFPPVECWDLQPD